MEFCLGSPLRLTNLLEFIIRCYVTNLHQKTFFVCVDDKCHDWGQWVLQAECSPLTLSQKFKNPSSTVTMQNNSLIAAPMSFSFFASENIWEKIYHFEFRWFSKWPNRSTFWKERPFMIFRSQTDNKNEYLPSSTLGVPNFLNTLK